MRHLLARILSSSATVLVAAPTLIVAPHIAQASTDWSFSGTASTVERGSKRVTITGDLTAPSIPSGVAYFGAQPEDFYRITDVCLVREGTQDPDFSQVFNHQDPRCRRWNFSTLQKYGSYGASPGSTHFVEWDFSAADGPGRYVVKFFQDQVDVISTARTIPGTPTIEIVEEVSRTATTAVTPSPTAVVGSTVDIGAVYTVRWSDGIETEEAPKRALTLLQTRPVGSTTWETESEESPHALSIRESVEARYLINGEVSTPVLITAIAPTSRTRFSSVVANSKRIFRGSPLVLQATMDALYTDRMWRPAQRERVQVQFSRTGRGGWKKVANAWISRGATRKNLMPTQSGFWRFRASDSASKAVFVRLLKP